MDRNEWLTLIIREANRFVIEHEAELKAAHEADGDLEALGAELDRHVHSVLVSVEDLWDLIRHSGLEDPPPELWQDADDWTSLLVRVAFACFAHDLGHNAEEIIAGRLPRIDPDQLVSPAEGNKAPRHEDPLN